MTSVSFQLTKKRYAMPPTTVAIQRRPMLMFLRTQYNRARHCERTRNQINEPNHVSASFMIAQSADKRFTSSP